MSATKKQKSSSPKYKVTYFNGRWLAEPIRLILSYVGEEFQDVRIEEEDWAPVKKNYRYGSVPELEDLESGEKFSQSFSIARYLGKRYNLVAGDILEEFKCDEYADGIKDLLKEVEQMWQADEATKLKVTKKILTESGPKLLSVINAELEGKSYLVGNKLTWADFLLAHFTELFEGFVDKSLLDNYPEVKAHQRNLFKIPNVKQWLDKRPTTEF